MLDFYDVIMKTDDEEMISISYETLMHLANDLVGEDSNPTQEDVMLLDEIEEILFYNKNREEVVLHCKINKRLISKKKANE